MEVLIEQSDKDRGKFYRQTLYNEIELTARYLKFLGKQLEEKFDAGINFYEFRILDLLHETPDICQNKIAKLLLINRANTGKLLNEMEKKELIIRTADTQKKKLIKTIRVTQKGEQLYFKMKSRLRPVIWHLDKKMTQEQSMMLVKLLSNLRQNLSELVDMNI